MFSLQDLKSKWIVANLLIVAASCCILSTAHSIERDTLEIINLKSAINNGSYQLYLRTPKNYSNQEKYPAIILLDANYYHGTFANLYDSIKGTDHDSHIIIGIGYSPNPMNDTIFIRDFTPSHISGFPNSGKADDFKQILDTELMPFILENYSIDKSAISIVGHHYSALFLTWLLTVETPKFSNYVIVSPVLTFNQDLIDFKLGNNSYSGIYLSSGSAKIKYVSNPDLNKDRFENLSKRLTNGFGSSNPIKTSHFPTPLRYDDLYKGFSEGIHFIMGNPIGNGNWNNYKKDYHNLVQSKSMVTIDRIIDLKTSNTYEITIQIPKNTTSNKTPVIVILDADFNFTELLLAAQQSMVGSFTPASLIVGIGYGTTIIGKGNYRGRDFLPNKLRKIESGNGKNFADVLNEQLITYLSQYQIDTTNMTISGHSYGGLFLAYMLTRKNLSFKNLLISSPAIWQDKTLLTELRKGANGNEAKIFIASGELNDNDKDAKQLFKVLKSKSIENLKLSLYPNESHLTVVTKAFKDGLVYFNQ